MTGRMQAGAFEERDRFGFGPGVGFADHGPLLEGRAFVAFLGGLGGVVHGEQDDGQAGGGRDVVRRAGLDAPCAFEADVFRVGEGAEQERDGEEGFSG